MNAIVIGQYIRTNSIIHKLDPRIKLLSMIILVVSIFLIPLSYNYIYLIFLSSLTVIFVIIIILSKIPLKKVFAGLKPILFLLMFTIIIQFFYEKSGERVFNDIPIYFSLTSVVSVLLIIFIYYKLKKYIKIKFIFFIFAVVLSFYLLSILKYVNFLNGPATYLVFTNVGIYKAAFLLLRVLNVVLVTSILTFTTSTLELNKGIEWLIHPLTYIKIDTEVFSMMLSLTLRHIPTLLEEAEKIMKSQASRGCDFSEGSLKDKVGQIISLLIPMFVISFQRAEDLANAMEVRGYIIGGKRTSIDQLKFRLRDLVSFIFVLILLSATIVVKILV
jgi:energy-coupling factor transport system permease protein